jgi:hypothetical protein
MSSPEWLSVAEFLNGMDADLVSRRLDIEGIPNRVVFLFPVRDRTNQVWVPPDMFERAKQVLSESAISEAELTKLALEEAPPDDV